MKKRVIAAVLIVGILLLLGVFYWLGYLVFRPLPQINFNPNTPQSTSPAELGGTPRLVIESITGRFNKVSADIKNVGDQDARSVNWSISVKGGILKRIDLRSTGTITLSKQSVTTVITDRIPFGLGHLEITVTVKASGSEPVTQTAQGFKLFFFVIRVRM